MSQQWGLAYDELSRTLRNEYAPMAAEVWMSNIITEIWQTILRTWEKRNEDEHGKGSSKSTRHCLQRERLQSQV